MCGTLGSSPRMRGKPQAGRQHRMQRRLIPAHAGKTRSLTRLTRRRQAHPRACGENNQPTNTNTPHRGSSPRMRGKLSNVFTGIKNVRLIPAHAGKTKRSASRRHEIRAHPRACGENKISFGVQALKLGSSPRMRGKQRPGERRDGQPRLIPAHAGKTGSHWRAHASRRAHPRACGENDVLG